MTAILGTCIALFVAGIIISNWQLHLMLVGEITTTNTLKQDADLSSENLVKAERLKMYIQDNSRQIADAATIVAESKTYEYQNQIIQDVTAYADRAGIIIKEFSFATDDSTASKTSVLKSTYATLTLDDPMSYTSYLTFLRLIEQNLTRMQITTIGLEPDETTPGMIKSPTIELKVYLK